jgi:hypothetical protein
MRPALRQQNQRLSACIKQPRRRVAASCSPANTTSPRTGASSLQPNKLRDIFTGLLRASFARLVLWHLRWFAVSTRYMCDPPGSQFVGPQPVGQQWHLHAAHAAAGSTRHRAQRPSAQKSPLGTHKLGRSNPAARGTTCAAWPNTSLNRRANGRPPGPAWQYAVHFRQSGPGVLPLSPG